GDQAGPRAPGRRQAHETVLNRVHVLNQSSGALAARQVKGLGRGGAGQADEQLRTQGGQRLQRRVVAGDALAIARGGAHDGEEADHGAGHHVVEDVGHGGSGAPGQGGGGDEPARQAQQQDGAGRHQGGGDRGGQQARALSLLLRAGQ